MSNIWTTAIWDELLRSSASVDVVGNEINARDSLHRILYGAGGRPPAGHWIVYRKYDRTRYSQYYNPIKGEAIGGPKYAWQDILLRTRRYKGGAIQLARFGEESLRPLLMEPGEWVYYFEFVEGITAQDGIQTINIEECLYEIDTPGSVYPPEITHNNLVEKYEFTRVEPIYDLYGRIEYFLVIARKTGGGRY